MFLRVAQSDLRAKKSFFVVIPVRNATGHIVHQRIYKFSIAQYPETRILVARPASAVEISRRRRNNFPFLHVPRALIFNKTQRGSGVPSHFLDFHSARNIFLVFAMHVALPLDLALPGALRQARLYDE